ncbi:MAG: T9SS type A sorting domain-containing protein [Flavobacteriales bacterium]|nr:T9SS type A sorting domain-containing protein [Flavobacteriales bacterium]
MNSLQLILRITLSFYFICTCLSGNAQTGDWQWAEKDGGNYIDLSTDIVIDQMGNSFLTGYSQKSSGKYDIIINKYDSLGNVIWSKDIGGNRSDHGVAMCLDDQGYCYLTGNFRSDSITFGNIKLYNSFGLDKNDMYIVKFDPSGNVVWAKAAGGSWDDGGQAITIDNNANIYIAGYFRSTSVIFGNDTLFRTDSYDGFIAKYDSAGNYIKSRSFGGLGDEFMTSINLVKNGGIVVSGYFSDGLNVDSISAISNGGYDIFAIKLDSSFNAVWTNSFGGTDDDYCYSTDVDSSGNIFQVGYYRSDTISKLNHTITNEGDLDIILDKLDKNGNIIWLKSIGGPENDLGNAICLDTIYGGFYITGSFNSSSISFGNYTLGNVSTLSSSDIFVSRFDSSGNANWAKHAGGSSSDFCWAMALNNRGQIHVAGATSSSPCYFDNVTINNFSSNDMFIAKLDYHFLVTAQNENIEKQIAFGPNPIFSNQDLTIRLSDPIENGSISIYDLNGNLVKLNRGLTGKNLNFKCDIAPGAYLLHLQSQHQYISKKIIIL